MKKQKYTNVMILTGKEAIIIPCLAVIGAASIVGAVGYGIHKLTKKIRTVATGDDKSFNDKVKERVEEYYESM